MGKEINAILGAQTILIWTFGLADLFCHCFFFLKVVGQCHLEFGGGLSSQHTWLISFLSSNYYRMAATLFVQPLDLVKNRMQLSGKQKFLFLALDKLSHPICV